MKVDPLRVSRFVRRAMLPLALLLFGSMWVFFGTLTIPPGMDTTPSVPPGSLCVIAKRPGSLGLATLRTGSLVFVEVGGGTLLTRIERIDADGIRVRHDNPASRFPDGDALGRVPRDAVSGLVLSVFRGGPGLDDGR